jgi:tRNA(Arg) A34 adenosine deaminase TadA
MAPRSAAAQHDDERFMRIAITEARAGIRAGDSPFGACLVRRGRVIARAHNTVVGSTDITAHAEVNLIRAACLKMGTIDLSGTTLYSTCEPCPMCFSAAHWARVDRIVFGARIADAKRAGFNELALSNAVLRRQSKAPVKIVGGVLAPECRALFREWLARPGRTPY